MATPGLNLTLEGIGIAIKKNKTSNTVKITNYSLDKKWIWTLDIIHIFFIIFFFIILNLKICRIKVVK